MKPVLLILAFLLAAFAAFAQYEDPNIPKPASGYGADGPHPVGKITFENPYFLGKDIEIYYPEDLSGPVPTIFYNHGYGGNFSSHVIGLLQFVAKKGYAIVFVPYQTTGITMEFRYENLISGFRNAARAYPNIIDTTQVGFMGHSFGGGACFANAYECFTENNWGQNGRFIYATAQWYSYYISQNQLLTFPQDTKLITEVFQDDVLNDHRLAADIFNNINIPDDEKDYITVYPDTLNGYVYDAGHSVPTTYQAFDALDYYAFYRLLDALCDYTFHGNPAGKLVALGNGSAEQTTMPGGLKPLTQTDHPLAVLPESMYMFPCSAIENLRKNYCAAATSGDNEPMATDNKMNVFPNPVTSMLTVILPENRIGDRINLYNSTGQLCYSAPVMDQQTVQIEVAGLPPGFYWVAFGGQVVKVVVG